MANAANPKNTWQPFQRLEADADFPICLNPRILEQPVGDFASPFYQDLLESLFADGDHAVQDIEQQSPFRGLSTFFEDPVWGNTSADNIQAHAVPIASDQVIEVSSLEYPVTLREQQGDPALRVPPLASLDAAITTPIVPEKPDPEDSWNEDEHSGEYGEFFKRARKVLLTVASTPGAFAITRPLPLRLRKAVHLLAHAEQCSHMSIGSGKERRVLVASDCLTTQLELPVDTTRSKRWSSSRSNFLIDPREIKIKNIPGDLSEDDFKALVSRDDVPAPTRWAFFPGGDILPKANTSVAFAGFEEAEDVAIFTETFSNCRLREKDPRGLIIQFVPIRRYTDVRITEDPVPAFGVRNVESISHSTAQRTDNAGIALGAVNPYDTRSHTEIQRMESRESLRTQASGYSSAADSAGHASISMFTDYDSEASGTKKRKRHPMVRSGYKCHYNGCDKVFDYSGERAKHERVHMPKDQRPKACGFCTLRFLDKKDLRRHEAIHTEAPGDVPKERPCR